MAEKQFGGQTFRCNKLPAKQATVLFFRLTRALGPLVEALDDLENDSAVLRSVGHALSQADPQVSADLVFDLTACAEVRDTQNIYNPVIYDIAFANDVALAFKVAAWVIQVNYADFFDGLAARMPSLRKVAEPPSPPSK